MKKKFAIILLSMMLMIPQAGFASEPVKSNALSQVITQTKSQIEIPTELSEFQYTEHDQGYDLNWHDTEGEAFLEVSCTDKGAILRYAYNDNKKVQKGQNISYDEAQKKAEAFLKKVAKAYEGELVLQPQIRLDLGDSYDLIYDRVHEGIKVFDEEVEVQVEKRTGKILYFAGIDYDAADQYDASKPTLTLKQAREVYLKEIGLWKSYRLYQDKPGEVKNFLVYQVNNREEKGIRALDGKVVKPYASGRNQVSYATAETAELKDSEMDAGGLSPAEQKAVQERKDFIEAEKVKEQAAMYFPALKNMKIKASSLIQIDQIYVRNLELVTSNPKEEDRDSAYLNVNALTGEILDYDVYLSGKQDKKAGQRWSKDQAAAFIQKIAPNEAKEVSFKEREKTEPSEDNPYQNIQFERQVKGIGVQHNGMTMIYNTSLKQVTSYHKNWSQTNFISAEGSLSPAQAMEKVELEPFYMQTDKDHYTLVYAQKDNHYLLDAFKGHKVDYSGKAIEDPKGGLYTDIKGTPYEKAIEDLYYNGIYLNREQLYPNAAITGEEMLTLLEQACGNKEVVYDLAKGLGWSEEGKKGANHKLTREEGIKLLVGATEYDKIAKMSELYQYPYKDEKVDPDLKGYITIAYGLGWLPKQEKLEPKEELSRGEAMSYLDKALETLSGF